MRARIVSGETFRDILGDSAVEIARLLPRLRKILPDLPPAPEHPPDVQRRNLFHHYREFVARAAKVRPIVALYDDLHWSDEATLHLLEHLAPHLSGLPILYIGTYRDVEQDLGRPWARTMGTLTRQRLADRIVLHRMPEHEVADLLAELGGSPPPGRVVHAVFEGTEGNPFFVEEVFQHLADEGRLFDDGGEWRPDLSAEELDVPEGVRIVIGRRLERLTDETLRMLGPAALIGRRFDLQVLEELEVLDPDALLDALDEAESARLVRSDSSARHAGYGFTHELIRQTLLHRLSAPRRQRWHRQSAEAIKSTYPDALDRRAADLAYHLYEAGGAADVDETRSFCMLAGRQALDGAAFEEALWHVRRAYSVDERDPPPEQKLLLERIRAEALWGTGIGEWPNAVATWLSALEIPESLEDGQAIVEICIAVNFGLLALDDHQTARETAQKGLAVLGDARVAARSLLLAKYGLATTFADFHSAANALDAAEEIARDLDDSLTLGRVLADRTGHLISWGLPREAIDAGTRGLELLDLTLDPMEWIITEAHVLLGMHVSGLHEEIVERAIELRTHADRFGNLYGQTFAVRAQMDMRLYTAGDWKAYEEFAAEAAELHSIFPSVAGRGQIFFAQCALNRREATQAYEMVCDGTSRSSTVGVWSPTWVGTLLWHAVRAGAPDIEQRATTVLESMPDPNEPLFIGWFDGLMASVEAFARWGRLEDAAALHPLMALVTGRGWKSGGGGGCCRTPAQASPPPPAATGRPPSATSTTRMSSARSGS